MSIEKKNQWSNDRFLKFSTHIEKVFSVPGVRNTHLNFRERHNTTVTFDYTKRNRDKIETDVPQRLKSVVYIFN